MAVQSLCPILDLCAFQLTVVTASAQDCKKSTTDYVCGVVSRTILWSFIELRCIWLEEVVLEWFG